MRGEIKAGQSRLNADSVILVPATPIWIRGSEVA